VFTDDGYKSFYDSGHYTLEGAKFFGRRLYDLGFQVEMLSFDFICLADFVFESCHNLLSNFALFLSFLSSRKSSTASVIVDTVYIVCVVRQYARNTRGNSTGSVRIFES
jgi:hypothetical protein